MDIYCKGKDLCYYKEQISVFHQEQPAHRNLAWVKCMFDIIDLHLAWDR